MNTLLATLISGAFAVTTTAPIAQTPAAVIAAARESNVTPAQVGLAWLLHHAPNVLLIPGTADPEHLEANVRAGAVTLDEATLSALDAVRTRPGDIALDQ